MKGIVVVAAALMSSASWAAAPAVQTALIEKLGRLMQRAQSTPQGQRIWVTQSDDLAPLKGASKRDLTTALGEPIRCDTTDPECVRGRTSKYLFAPADRPSGQVLVVHFDSSGRVESAVWDVTQ
jgi:hypothetical protein